MSKRSRNDKEAPKGGPLQFNTSSIILLVVVVLLLVLLFRSSVGHFGQQAYDYKDLNELVADAKAGDISTISIATDGSITGTYGNAAISKPGIKNPREFTANGGASFTQGPIFKQLWDLSQAVTPGASTPTNGLKITIEKAEWYEGFLPFLLIGILPFLLIWLLFRSMMRGAGGPGGVLSFGKSRHSLISKDKTKKTFKDVAGIEEAKYEVEELVGFLKNPKKFQRLGARIPRGVLLIGPPGTGKTLLAKAIAGEADVPFFSISGSDFVEMFVGVGASRVRDLFEQAREHSPCIIFLDEIDAVGRRRGTGLGGGHDEREQTLNAILVEMDGFESDEKIIVMAATNRPDVLDPALLRPGRFDRHVYVELPDVRGREEILKVHASKVRLAPDVSLNALARGTPGFSGAKLENMINEAALIAVKNDHPAITMEDLDDARDKVMMGVEKRRRMIDKKELWNTAYHETGHALVSYLHPDSTKPHKVTIIPRGPAMGMTQILPDRDMYSYSKTQLKAQLQVLYAGRIAEELFTGDISTGAKGDIDQATHIIRKMVTEFGMSEKLGPISYESDEEDTFLGRDIGRTKMVSDKTNEMIDNEVRKVCDEMYQAATELMVKNAEHVHHVARALMEYESLTFKEIKELVETGKLSRPAVHDVTEEFMPRSAKEDIAKLNERKHPKDDHLGGLQGLAPA
ncbi:MAG: ATP-dependent zinc metalloprotease FtsH [Planctomycetota bacterium]